MLQVLLVAKPGEQASKQTAELGRCNVMCSLAVNEESVLEQAERYHTDVLVIDLSVAPEADRLFRYLRREKKLPVLALTTMEMAFNLDGTADDFAVIPINASEVAARVKRLAARGSKEKHARISAGNIVIDTEQYEVLIDGRPVSLTFREYELLRFMATNPGRVFTRDALLNHVWGNDYFGGDRTVDVHIRRLRSKIEDEKHIYIETVRNIGYRFVKT
jgi:DNA-binding response OmpR family regulator